MTRWRRTVGLVGAVLMVRCVSVSVLWSGELQGLVPQRLLQVFRHQPQPGGLWSSLLLLCATTEPGQNQNYVLLITSIHKEKGHKHFSLLSGVLFPLQTVLNTMCGYGMQQLEERSARQDVFTIGCLEKIASWAKNNLLLVAGLTAGLLLLEVKMEKATTSAQISEPLSTVTSGAEFSVLSILKQNQNGTTLLLNSSFEFLSEVVMLF